MVIAGNPIVFVMVVIVVSTVIMLSVIMIVALKRDTENAKTMFVNVNKVIMGEIAFHLPAMHSVICPRIQAVLKIIIQI